MSIDLSRRSFLRGAGAGVAGTTLGALGFGEIEAAYAASIRPYKLVNTSETRNTCTYCSVACGIILYSKGDLRKGERAEITYVEGDSDHPVRNRHPRPQRIRGMSREVPGGDDERCPRLAEVLHDIRVPLHEAPTRRNLPRAANTTVDHEVRVPAGRPEARSSGRRLVVETEGAFHLTPEHDVEQRARVQPSGKRRSRGSRWPDRRCTKAPELKRREQSDAEDHQHSRGGDAVPRC